MGNILRGKKKITCTKSLKGRIIEFSKVFCFVFSPLIHAQDKIRWTCVWREIKCCCFLKAALFFFVFVESEQPDSYPQVEIEFVRWKLFYVLMSARVIDYEKGGPLETEKSRCRVQHQSDSKPLVSQCVPVRSLFSVRCRC